MKPKKAATWNKAFEDINLTVNLDIDVNPWLYWDARHCQNDNSRCPKKPLNIAQV
jgi:hypothetical protein